MQAFKCNMWLLSILMITYIYGCVGEEEALFTNKPPNIEQTDINKTAIFEVNTQIASSDGEEDSSTLLLDRTTYATEILPTDAIDRDNNVTETATIAGSDNNSAEITDDWDMLDEGYLDGDKFDLDDEPLPMADYDSYANNDTEDVSIKEMLKMNLSDEKLKGIMIIQDWLNNEKESIEDGEITTTEFSQDKYDEYLKTFNYDEIDAELLNEENLDTEAIPEINVESTTESDIQSTIYNTEIEQTTIGLSVTEDKKSDLETTEVPETTTKLPNKSEQVEEVSEDIDRNAEETSASSDTLNYSSTESTTILVNEIETSTVLNNISDDVTTHYEESDPATTTLEEITESLDATINYKEIDDLMTTEYVIITTVENENISESTATESSKIFPQTTEAITTQSAIETENIEVSTFTTELIENVEKTEELEFTTLSPIDIQTEISKNDLDAISDNEFSTKSAIGIQTEINADDVLNSEMLDILEELNDEINSTIEFTTQSSIQTEFSIEENSTDPIITLEDKFEFDALDNDDHFNTTEFEVDLKDNSVRISTDEPSTNPISSLENEDAFEALNNDNNFNTTESVFENVSQDKAESNSTDTISKLDEENVVEDIDYSQANLNATVIVEDSSVELEGERTNNSLLTTQSTMHELAIQNETDVALNERDNLEKPDKISFDTVDLEQGATTDDTLLTTQFSLDIQTESDQESIEINELANSSNPDEKLENQNELVETDTEKIIDISLSESSSSMNETVIDNSTELNNVTNSVILESDTTDNILLTSQSELEEAQTQVDIDEVTTKIVDEFEKQNIDLQSGLIDNALLTTQSVVDVETESQKLSGSEQNTISINEILETTTQIYNNMGGIVEEVTTGINNYDFNSTEEIITEETSPNTIETVETSTYVDVNEISTESVTIVKVQELEKEFVEKNKESETGNEDVNSLENVKEMINKYNSLETESDSQNVDVLKEVDFENEESFIDIMHSSEDEWNANKDLFTTRSSTVVTENVDEDKMFTLSESVAEEINPIVVENEMEIESDRISGTTGRVETSTSESLHTVETELNLNNKEEVDDLSAEETGIDKVIVDNDLEEEDVANTTEQASNKRIHQEVVTKTVPIEESTKSSVVIDESDEADITSLNNAESSEDETRSSTELETVIPIENNGRFIFDLLTTTVTPLYEETTDSPTEKPTKDRLSEEKINLDEEIISPEVEKTTDHTSTTDKSIDIIKNDAVFYNINLKPISNNDRHNILLNLKEESSSSDEIVDYLETISEDGDYIKETGDDSEEISNDKLDEIFNYSEEFEETLNEIEEILEENSEDAPYITTTVSNHNKQQCLSLNISMSIKINETNIVVPDTAKISGNCSEYFIVSWKSAFDPAENNSIHFNLIRKDDCVYLQSIGVHVMKDDGESFIDEANDDLNLDADDTNYVMLNNGLSVQLDMSLKRKNVALEKPTTLKSTNTLALQITSGIASILILLVVVGVFIYRRHRGQTRILKVTIDK